MWVWIIESLGMCARAAVGVELNWPGGRLVGVRSGRGGEPCPIVVMIEDGALLLS